MKKSILLVNDMAGHSKVAAAAMIPLLSYMGYTVSNLPTALVSNTFNYGKFALMETTDYMAETIRVWKELGFRFDALVTGFLCSDRQAEVVSSFCKEQAQAGAVIFVDPVMGDDGKLYHGLTSDRVDFMREFVGVAHLSFPNYTEACLLAGKEWQAGGVTEREMLSLVDDIVHLGSRSVIVTSARVDGHSCVAGYNADNGEHFVLPYDEVPAYFHGTGDVFSAIVIGNLLDGTPLRESAQMSMEALIRLISSNQQLPDKYRGLPLESCLELVRK